MTDTSGESPVGGSSSRISDVPISHVRVSVRSAFGVMALLALTVLMLEIARHSERVIAWVLTAGAIAVLVYPAVQFGSRWLPRVLVVVILVIVGLGTIGFVGYRLVSDVTKATDSLQNAAPRRAAQLEKNSDLLRQVHLTRRVKNFVDGLPSRLTGGSATKALESAATRGVAFVAGLILTIFFVLYGPRIMDGGLDQIRDPSRRQRVERIVVQGTRRGLDYARIKVLEALVEGVLAYIVARAAGVPGPAALGVWVAVWTLLPIAGVFVGALPIVVFAGAASLTRAVVVGLIFVAIGVAEFAFTSIVEHDTVEVGSFLIVFAAFGGLELDGLSGALLGILGIVVFVAILDEFGREDPQREPASGLLIPRRE
jgi:predicted PurR-regulated permease PerM